MVDRELLSDHQSTKKDARQNQEKRKSSPTVLNKQIVYELCNLIPKKIPRKKYKQMVQLVRMYQL
jgi:hypothetical protein